MDSTLISGTAFARLVINKIPEIESKVVSDEKVDLVVPASKIREIVHMIEESYPLIFPESVFGVDLEDDKYEAIYIFWSRQNNFLCQLRVSLEGPNPEIDTISDIFPGMEWHERETCEMYGIDFKGHPDLRLLLLPDELEGKFPLRKSFKTDRSRLSESGLPQPKPRPPRGGDSQ
ncbi:MAG: NADH-quinone oxidoreductase subunit C [Candidatus Thorarchaeota archaeon]